ncbi:MAG: thioredoxin family protein [Candidatus Cyclobacteriaceae bacterium M2_1C_046]
MEILDITDIIKGAINKSISYTAYKALMAEQIIGYQKPEDPKKPDLGYYAKLNYHRIARLDKTVQLLPEVVEELKNNQLNQTWLLITEGWCGDAAQSVPVINKMAEAASDINLKLVLRDQNIELMDQFLTNGGRSIPKLIILDKDGQQVLGTWGPRPVAAQQLMIDLKQKETPYPEITLQIQKWYAEDKTISIQKEIIELMNQLK